MSSRGFEERSITVFTTPTELRNMAAEMERRWRRVTPGESVLTEVWYIGDTLKIQFGMDQEKMTKEHGPSGKDVY